jgi:putative SOS response-associated peptidase YedK
MCTAYQIGTKANRLPARIKPSLAELLRRQPEPRIIRPTLIAPVILPDGTATEMSWGFRRKFRGSKGNPITRTIVNSREDKLDSPMWRDAFANRRCLIPAIAFYEWTDGPGGKARPLRFTPIDDNWLLLGGIWENGENGPCFSMLTTEPSDAIRPVHDRMPLVLSDENIGPYLDGELNQFGSSKVPLLYQETPNFLRPTTPPDHDPNQPTLL